MKIRTGFVSNSSSSSFCIYGIQISEDEVKEALLSKGLATEEELIDGISEYLDDWSYQRKKKEGKLTEEDIEEENKRFFRKEEGWLFDGYPYDSDYSFLGLPWKLIGDNETGAQFKAKVEEKLKELLGEDIKCGTHEECWQDG